MGTKQECIIGSLGPKTVHGTLPPHACSGENGLQLEYIFHDDVRFATSVVVARVSWCVHYNKCVLT